MAILRNLLGGRALEESHRTTAGTPSILPKSFRSSNLRNLIHSNRRFQVKKIPFLSEEGGPSRTRADEGGRSRTSPGGWQGDVSGNDRTGERAPGCSANEHRATHLAVAGQASIRGYGFGGSITRAKGWDRGDFRGKTEAWGHRWSRPAEACLMKNWDGKAGRCIGAGHSNGGRG